MNTRNTDRVLMVFWGLGDVDEGRGEGGDFLVNCRIDTLTCNLAKIFVIHICMCCCKCKYS